MMIHSEQYRHLKAKGWRAAGLLLLFVISAAGKPASGQDHLQLSLDQAITHAVNNNRNLSSARFGIDKSQQTLRENIAQGLPQINASLDYNNFLGANASIAISPEAPPATIEFNPTSNFKASVSQLVFSGNYIVGISMLKISRTISEENFRKTELDVREQTINAYCSILAAERIAIFLLKTGITHG